MVEEAYYDNNHRSWCYPVVEEYSAVVVGKDAGYLIKAAVA